MRGIWKKWGEGVPLACPHSLVTPISLRLRTNWGKVVRMDPNLPGSLEDELRDLRDRVQRLETALTRQGILAPTWTDPAAAAPPAPAHSPAPAPPPVQAIPPTPAHAEAKPWLPPPPPPRPVTPPSFATLHHDAPQSDRSLESRIGSQWFNRIGIIAMLIGVAWFLKFAFDNHWVGPSGRILIGLIAGAGLIAWSERFRAHGYKAFSYSLKSVGSGILYLSLWAAFALYHLIPGSAAFFAMIAVTAFNGFLSWMQDSELLAVYAIAGALGTPILVSTGENHEVALFSYILLLDLAVLILVALRPWSRLLFGAFLGTIVYATGWSLRFYSADQFATTAFFIACFFVVFALAPRLVRIEPESPEENISKFTSAWDKLATILLPILNASLGFLAFYGLLDSKDAAWAQPWLAVAFAAFYLALLRMPASGRFHSSPALLPELHLAATVVFLTIAIPLKASGRWITIGWLAEGAALLWIAARTRSAFLRVLAGLCFVLALCALLTINPYGVITPVFNHRFATYLFAIAVFAFVAWLAYRSITPEQTGFDHAWPAIAGTSVLLINLLILIAVSLEIHTYWSGAGWSHGYAQYMQNRIYAQFTYSAFFMAFGAILLVLGFSRHSAFLRWQALTLLTFAIAKVFLVDTSELSQGYRILSFLALGALLLAVSFVYQRDWLHLRGGHDA